MPKKTGRKAPTYKEQDADIKAPTYKEQDAEEDWQKGARHHACKNAVHHHLQFKNRPHTYTGLESLEHLTSKP
jgi:hypothetical protein